MKQGIHPKYEVITVKCGCGNTFETRSTIDKISVEVCSNCHPFYTGKQKFVDTAGRVERFQKRWKSDAAAKAKAATAEKKVKKASEKVAEIKRQYQTLATQFPEAAKKPAAVEKGEKGEKKDAAAPAATATKPTTTPATPAPAATKTKPTTTPATPAPAATETKPTTPPAAPSAGSPQST